MNRIDPPSSTGGKTPLPSVKFIGWADAKRRDIKAMDAPAWTKLAMLQVVREADRMFDDVGVRPQLLDRGAVGVPVVEPLN